jgi:hypothetical protein
LEDQRNNAKLAAWHTLNLQKTNRPSGEQVKQLQVARRLTKICGLSINGVHHMDM